MSKRVCAGCSTEFEGHGNRDYCPTCLTTTCAACGATITLKHPSYRRENNYCGSGCMENTDLREYVAANRGTMSQSAMARVRGVSRQRIGQLIAQMDGVKRKRRAA